MLVQMGNYYLPPPFTCALQGIRGIEGDLLK